MFERRQKLKGGGKPRTPIAGVGINDATYMPSYRGADGKTVTCPFYATWSGMLNRVFNPKNLARAPSYIGCTVDEGWKTFSMFSSWMEQQDWVGKALDKDLLVQGNKHYGPDTCIFVPQLVNSLLALRTACRGDQPLGVHSAKYNSDSKESTYYTARISCYGKQRNLGSYDTAEEAAHAYAVAKTAYAHELAIQQSDPRLRQALLRLVF